MFRFTIRDVLWLTVVVALGVAWLVENRHSRAAVTRANEAREHARSSEARSEYLDEQIERIDKQLAEHGLRVGWMSTGRGLRAVVCEDDPNKNPTSN